MSEQELQEENQKIMRNQYELREAECRNKRNTALMCNKEMCVYFGTCYCVHPEHTFNSISVRRY